jgi:deoxyribose-phosphate aldolase
MAMTLPPAELEHLVAQIGEEILARVRSAEPVCRSCTQSCPEGCAQRTAQVIAAGADRVSSCSRVVGLSPSIAALIDHTLLKPEATREDIHRLCREARQYGFASVCLNPYWVSLATAELKGSPVKVCTVVGFPLGANTTPVKVAESDAALRDGAQELDMVINIGALRSGDQEAVLADIRAVVETAHRAGAVVKTILETALLDDNQKVVACTLARLAGADFVKTSTGFGPGGATAQDVALMRLTVGPQIGVKAAGGIRSLEDLKTMVAAGATRIGASASVKIIEAACA